VSDPWYHYRARAYRADAGRFVQRDPVPKGGQDNLYRYVVNRPMDLVDPLGTTPFVLGPPPGGAVLGVVAQSAPTPTPIACAFQGGGAFPCGGSACTDISIVYEKVTTPPGQRPKCSAAEGGDCKVSIKGKCGITPCNNSVTVCCNATSAKVTCAGLTFTIGFNSENQGCTKPPGASPSVGTMAGGTSSCECTSVSCGGN
jgi:hypothetical protein